jgi:hypothetical protein
VFALREDTAALKRVRVARGVRLLPGFDPYVLFPHSDRPVPAAHLDRVYRKAAWISATVVVDGAVVGVWEQRTRGERVEITVSRFGSIGRAARDGVAREADLLARYLGGRADLRIA